MLFCKCFFFQPTYPSYTKQENEKENAKIDPDPRMNGNPLPSPNGLTALGSKVAHEMQKKKKRALFPLF
jgi:hypothetical protein